MNCVHDAIKPRGNPDDQHPIMTTSKSPASFRDRQKDNLVEIAEKILADEGLPAVQARRITKDAACAIGTLYNIFGDINGLILAANERTLNGLGFALQAAANRSECAGLEARLQALAIAYLEFAMANTRRWRAVFDHTLPECHEVPAFYVENRQSLLALVEAELAPVIADAAARTDAAHALFSAVHGIVLLSLDEKLGTFDAPQCRRQITFLIQHISRGLG